MSLIVTVRSAEGIVMAADSRVSMQVRNEGDLKAVSGIRHYSDHFPKILSAPNGMGISFCGEMAIEKGNLNVFTERFIKENITPDTPVSAVAPMLLEYMRRLPKIPATIFHLCGYERKNGEAEPCFLRVIPKKNSIEEIREKQLVWDGEGDILARLISPVAIRTPQGGGPALPDYPVAVSLFTLQDAVDFADYAIRVTEEAMRFQIRPKTVGGPRDILVIRPDETLWIRRKTLGEPK